MIEATLDGPYQYDGGPGVGWIVGRLVRNSASYAGADRMHALMVHGVSGKLFWVPVAKIQRYPQGQIEQPTK